MRTMDDTLELFRKNSRIVKLKGLSEEECKSLIKDYHHALKEVLFENGYVQFSDQVRIDVVKLRKRVHVLRGQPYENHRSYKLKARMGYNLYQKLSESFDAISME